MKSGRLVVMMFAGRRVDDEVAALWLVLFLFSKQGGQGNRNEVRRWVVTGVEVDEVGVAEQGVVVVLCPSS